MPNVSISDIVTFEDEVVSTTKVETVIDTLNFIESIFSRITFVLLNDYLYLGDGLISSNPGSTFNRALDDTLIFDDVFAAGQHIETLNDVLLMIDWLELPKATDIFETLVFSENITTWAGPALVEILTLEDEIIPKLVSVLSILDSLVLVDAFSIYYNNPWIPSGPVPTEAPCV